MSKHATHRSPGSSRRTLAVLASIAVIVTLVALYLNRQYGELRDDGTAQSQETTQQAQETAQADGTTQQAQDTAQADGTTQQAKETAQADGTTQQAQDTAQPPPGAAPSFAVVGDSITEAHSPDINAGKPSTGSWTYYAADGARFVGGWARSGATTSQMAANTTPLQADCLVILAGTNDLWQDVPFDVSAANLRTIVERAGLPTVILSTIPPFDPDPRAAASYNERLVDLAAAEGWILTDPMEGIRAGDTFRPSMTSDGVHPTDEAARIIGEGLRAAVLGATTAP